MTTLDGLSIRNPEKGTFAKFALHTKADEALVAEREVTSPGAISLEEIEAAKKSIAIDALDGKLDWKVGDEALQRPKYMIFWTQNSAANLMIALATGSRELYIGGQKVEVTQAYRQWALSTMSFESAQAPA